MLTGDRKIRVQSEEILFFFSVNSGEIDESIIWKLKQFPTVRGGGDREGFGIKSI